MRVLPALLAATVAGLAVWLWLGEGGTPPPRVAAPEADAIPASPPPPEGPPRVVPTTGTLVIRVTTEDGTAIPAGAKAGYTRPGGASRLRGPGPDGTIRFTDAPVGELDLIAEAEGYKRGTARVVIVPGVAAEAVVSVAPVDPAMK